MSFLESSSNGENQPRLIGKEFKDPFSFSNDGTPTSNLSSRNKWSTSEADLKRRSYNRAHTDANNNNSHSNVYNNRKSFGGNRNSCTISFDELHGGKDEINAISENDKPILRLWAQKNKTNAAISAANRNSYLGTSNDSKKVMSQLAGTSWGKHLKSNNTLMNRMSNGVETINEERRHTKSERASNNVSTTANFQREPLDQNRPKSAYYERNLDKSLQKVDHKSLVSPNKKDNTTITPVAKPKEKTNVDHQEKTDPTKDKNCAVTEKGEDSFLDELLDLEDELKRQLNDKPPPPVPRRSSSRSSDLVGIFKKLNRDAATTTPKSPSSSSIRTTGCSTPTTAATITSTTTTTDLVSQSNTKEREDPGCLSKTDIVFDSENDIRSKDIRVLHEEGKSKSITNHIIKSDVNDSYKNCQFTADDNNNTQTHYDFNSSCSQINKKTLNRTIDKEMGERCSDEKKTTPFNYSKKVRERKARSSSANNEYIYSNFLAKQPVTQPTSFQRTRADTSVSSSVKDSCGNSVEGAELVIVSSCNNVCLDEPNSTSSGIATKGAKEIKKQNNPNTNCVAVAKLLRRNEFIPISTFEIKQVDIDIEPDSVNTGEENKSFVDSYTDIESQITGVVGSQKLEKEHLPDFVALEKQTIETINSCQDNKEVSLTPRRKSEVEIETKTNIVVSRGEQTYDAEYLKEKYIKYKPDANENNLTNGHIEEQEMGSRYYSSTPRSSNSFNSYYDRQHDSTWTTSPLSTQLSRYNNESANISDKYFGRKSNLDSNDYSVHTNRYERSYSLNEDYSRPSHLTKSLARKTSVDSSDNLGSSYVPKSTYLRQRLLELKANEKDNPRVIKNNSFTSEDSSDISSYSNKSSNGVRRASLQRHEEKVDEFIRNFRERRSSYQSTPPYSPTLTSTVISSTSTTTSSNHNTAISSFSNTETTTVNKEQSVFTFPSTISKNHLISSISSTQESPTVEDRSQFQQQKTLQEEDTKSSSFDYKSPPTSPCKSPLSPDKSDAMDSVFKRKGSLKNAVARRFSISSGDSKKNKEKEDDKLNDIQESPFDKTTSSVKVPEKDSKSEKSSASVAVTTTKNRFGKEKSTFGSITKITSSKISAASDLKAFSSRKKDKLKADTSKFFNTLFSFCSSRIFNNNNNNNRFL